MLGRVQREAARRYRRDVPVVVRAAVSRRRRPAPTDQPDLVTVVLGNGGSERTRAACLDRVVLQSYRRLEIVLAGGPDVRGTARRFTRWDRRVRYVAGVPGVDPRVTALEAATGRFVLFLDPQVVLDQDAIERLARSLRQSSSDLVVAGTPGRRAVYGLRIGDRPRLLGDGRLDGKLFTRDLARSAAAELTGASGDDRAAMTRAWATARFDLQPAPVYRWRGTKAPARAPLNDAAVERLASILFVHADEPVFTRWLDQHDRPDLSRRYEVG